MPQKYTSKSLDIQNEIVLLTVLKHSLKNIKTWGYQPLKKAIAKYERWQMTVGKKDRLEATGPTDGIMFVGTNPSTKSGLISVWEDPFGKYFSNFLASSGINYKEIYFTNLFKTPTPDNRPLNQEEIQQGWKELQLEITYVDPTIIIPMGKQCRELFSIKEYEKKKWNLLYDTYGLPHPSFVTRFPEKKVEFIHHLKLIKKSHDTKRICRQALIRREDRGADRPSTS